MFLDTAELLLQRMRVSPCSQQDLGALVAPFPCPSLPVCSLQLSNKLPQTWWLTVTHISSISVEGRHGQKSRCQQSLPLWRLGDKFVHMAFLAPRGHPHSLACGPFFHLQGQQHGLSGWPLIVMCPLLGLLTRIGSPWDSFRP